mgnify:CR=1 FL=1|nr:MAG TPA: hypothetical protein [Caudoviricetes sp.]
MEKEIFIKSFFSGWRKVTKKQAESWADNLINNAGHRKNAIEIARKRLKGITLEELIKL